MPSHHKRWLSTDCRHRAPIANSSITHAAGFPHDAPWSMYSKYFLFTSRLSCRFRRLSARSPLSSRRCLLPSPRLQESVSDLPGDLKQNAISWTLILHLHPRSHTHASRDKQTHTHTHTPRDREGGTGVDGLFSTVHFWDALLPTQVLDGQTFLTPSVRMSPRTYSVTSTLCNLKLVETRSTMTVAAMYGLTLQTLVRPHHPLQSHSHSRHPLQIRPSLQNEQMHAGIVIPRMQQ